MKRLIILSFILLLLIISGCKFGIYSEIYLSDVYEFTQNPASKCSIFSTIKLEILSEDTYRENKDKITNILLNYFWEIDNVRFEKGNLENYYVGDVDISFVRNKDESKTLVWLTVDKDGILYMGFNKNAFEELSETVLTEFYQTLDIKDFNIEIVLVNDLKKDIVIEGQGVYINNKPMPFLNKVSVKNRQKIKIVFSNVLRDYMVDNEITPFVKIYW